MVFFAVTFEEDQFNITKLLQQLTLFYKSLRLIDEDKIVR